MGKKFCILKPHVPTERWWCGGHLTCRASRSLQGHRAWVRVPGAGVMCGARARVPGAGVMCRARAHVPGAGVICGARARVRVPDAGVMCNLQAYYFHMLAPGPYGCCQQARFHTTTISFIYQSRCLPYFPRRIWKYFPTEWKGGTPGHPGDTLKTPGHSGGCHIMDHMLIYYY